MEVIDGENVATNKTTGAKIVFRGGAWSPYTPKAAAPSGAPTGGAPAPPADASTPPAGAADASPPADTAAPKSDTYQPPGVSDRLGNIWDNLSSWGKAGEQIYEKYPGRALNKVAATGLDVLSQAPQDWAGQTLRDIHTPYEQLPEGARDIAEAIMPQDIASAELMAMGMKYPGIKVERELGDVALGPLERMMSSRLGRTATTTAVGAGTGAVTGTGAITGGLQGLLGFGGPEIGGKAIEKYGTREAAQDVLRKDTTAKVGKALQSYIPWAGEIRTGEDFKNLFVHGQAEQKAQQILTNTKKILSNHFGNHLFDLPNTKLVRDVIKDGRPLPTKMTFEMMDKLRTELQQGYGYTLKGAEKAGVDPRIFRKVALSLRDHMADQMDMVKQGLGAGYKKNLKQLSAAKELGNMFGTNIKALFNPKYGLNQPELIDRIDKAAPELENTLGPGTAKGLLDVLKRGFVGEGKDLPRKVDQHLWLKHALGRGLGGMIGGGLGGFGLGGTSGAAIGGLAGGLGGIALGGGQSFDPAGKVPWSMRPSLGPVEALASNLFRYSQSDVKPPTISPAIKDAQQRRAQSVAGPHASADKVSAIQGRTEAIAKGDSPNVQRDLENHSLSMGNVRKMLDNSNTNIQTAFNDLSPSDAIDAFSKASKDERQALLPSLAQHLQNTAGQMPPEQRQQMLAQLQAAMGSDEGVA
jgi:hypothetical protein